MPSNRVFETAYIGPFADIGSVNSATAYYPGQIGQRINEGNKGYQFVQLDTGVLTSATNGQVLYWKDTSNYIVTNNNLFAYGGSPTTTSTARNMIAGIATTTVTAGYYTFIQQKGPHSAVVAKSGSPAAGAFVVGDTTTAQVDSVAVATAPTVDVIGHVTTTQSSTTSWPVNLNIEGLT